MSSLSLVLAENKAPMAEQSTTSVMLSAKSLRAKLEKKLSEPGGNENSVEVLRIRRDLAKIGDRKERSDLIMRLKSDSPQIKYGAIQDAEYVGGSDMIFGLAQLLDAPEGYDTATTLHKTLPDGEQPQCDIIYEPVSIAAAMALAEIVENPPVPPIGENKKFYTKDDVKKWLEWRKSIKMVGDAVQTGRD